jgi:hypothetical protein
MMAVMMMLPTLLVVVMLDDAIISNYKMSSMKINIILLILGFAN